jgi:hypothetical protein
VTRPFRLIMGSLYKVLGYVHLATQLQASVHIKALSLKKIEYIGIYISIIWYTVRFLLFRNLFRNVSY